MTLRFWITSHLFGLLFLVSRIVEAATPFADVGIESSFSSNVYLNTNAESDWVNAPRLAVGLDFADYWTAGYRGALESYLLHSDLFYHEHALFLLANPLFGPADQHELLTALTVGTQRNTDTYATLNLVEPELLTEVSIEPIPWLRLTLSEDLSFQLFYEDTLSSSLNSWTKLAIGFIAQSKTTVTPRVAYGMRFFPETDPAITTRRTDQQLEAGIHVSQGLTEGVGLQADYAYVQAFDDSVLTLRKMSNIDFYYIGEAFIYSGHRASMGLKAIFENGMSFGVFANYAYKRFGGWAVLDSEGTVTGEEREDHVLEPRGWVKYTFSPNESASPAVPDVSVGPYYAYRRQWSNDAWFDCDRHKAGLELQISW